MSRGEQFGVKGRVGTKMTRKYCTGSKKRRKNRTGIKDQKRGGKRVSVKCPPRGCRMGATKGRRGKGKE